MAMIRTSSTKIPPTISFHSNADDGKVIAGVAIGIVFLVIMALLVVFVALRFARKLAEKGREKQPPSQMQIPDYMQALSDSVNFTIPTAPQMPHEMQRGYIRHIRASQPCTTARKKRKRDKDNSGTRYGEEISDFDGLLPSGASPVRPARLGLIGKSKSAQTASTKRTLFAMSRSKSVPCKLERIDDPIASNIGMINKKLYTSEADIQEFCPSKYGLGKLSFSMTYQKDIGLLTVNLIQAAQLPVLTQHQKTADTSVKISFIPDVDNNGTAISRIFKRSLNPRFNQTFVFTLEKSLIAETVIRFVVFEYDKFSHPQVVGKAEYELVNHDFDISDASQTIWRDLVDHPWEDELPPVDTSRGELLCSLNYLPIAERLNIVVLKARNLRTSIANSQTAENRNDACLAPSGKTALGIYVKVTCVKGGKQIKTKQTCVVRKDLNPVFNESFAMDLKNNELDMACIVFSVCLRVNHLKCHRVLGRCVLGGEVICSGKPLAHWNGMLASPRNAVAQWHTLK